MRRTFFYLIAALALHPLANAVILYSGDNNANQTAPDVDRQAVFDSIGRLAGSNLGSVVHVRGKYLLTANHVKLNSNSVSFDGTTTYNLDTAFSPIKIGPADMKLIKLVEDPGLPETPLNDSVTGDVLVDATFIGWGVGRNPDVADSGTNRTTVWEWGDGTNLAKRWGTNTIELAGSGLVRNDTYDYLETRLNRNAGDSEAAATLFDSGSGLFISDNGVWKLAGLTTAVSTVSSSSGSPPTSTFGSGTPVSPNDWNRFVRISSYVNQIEAAIPDTSTYSGWKIDHSLYGDDALNEADTDNDEIEQLLEFALGGDPNQNDRSILPEIQRTTDGPNEYLELVVTRPKGLTGLIYAPKTTSDLTVWPSDSTGIENPSPTPIDNGDGTETLIYRRAQAISGDNAAFIRLEVSES